MAHSSTHRGCQTFRFLTRCWCVTRALELIESDVGTAELVDADIIGLDVYLDLTPASPGMVRLLVVEVDKVYALTKTNLDIPLVAVRIRSNGSGDLGGMVIDGWHRAYRARVEGRSTLPVYVLSTEAEEAVRVDVW